MHRRRDQGNRFKLGPEKSCPSLSSRPGAPALLRHNLRAIADFLPRRDPYVLNRKCVKTGASYCDNVAPSSNILALCWRFRGSNPV